MNTSLQIAVQKSWVNGTFLSSTASERLTNINPATDEVLCDVEVALSREVDAAVASASAGQGEWARMTGTQRGRILARTAQLLRSKNEELACLEVLDTGKPISEARVVDVQTAADALEYFAGLAPAIKGEHYQLGDSFAYTRREPLGVVGGIGAWNYPLQIACWKAGPALAAGNAMIFKPSELTPLTALRLAEVFKEAGLPDGIFNVLLGDGRTGQLMVAHPGISKISVTGSVNTGRNVMAGAAATLKHVTCELGGKSPLIIFELSDKAIQAAIDANFYTQGEICSNGTRVFVHASIHEEFLKRVVEKASKLRVGDPMDAATQVGSLISRKQMERVLNYIAQGKQQGARLRCGGERIGTTGSFVAPTIFSDCRDDMTIVREEIFGPVMSVLSFKDEEEVIKRANGTPYGLAAGVFTSNLNQAHRIVAKLQAGICWINSYNVTPVEIPFGGYKQSGLGRENSEWALHEYTQIKTVYVDGRDS